MSNLSLKPTHDGSFTIHNSELNETYHSIHGARQESEHVYIKNGLQLLDAEKLNILEVGVGTGLNLLLTMNYIKTNKSMKVKYTGLEPYPIEEKLLEEYISTNSKTVKEKETWIAAMYHPKTLSSSIFIEHLTDKVQNLELVNQFDIIYFDAFAPTKQSEMWGVEVFENLYKMAKTGCLFTTYCAQGQFKRNLAKAGFRVENVPGPPGKREMTLGFKD